MDKFTAMAFIVIAFGIALIRLDISNLKKEFFRRHIHIKPIINTRRLNKAIKELSDLNNKRKVR